MLGAHMLKAWSSTQPTITLSSGEAELHGVVRASAAGLGMLALLADFGAKLPMRVWTDSTASIGICKRQGLGKVRHLAVQDLWVQQRVRAGDFELYKVPGERNPADLFTKFGLPPDRIEMLLQLLGCHFAEGRPASAPSLKIEGGLRIFQIDSAGAVTEKRPSPGRLLARETVEHRRRYTTSHYHSREAWALAITASNSSSPQALMLGDSPISNSSPPQALTLGDSQRHPERAHTLPQPRRERWSDSPEDFEAELPEEELKSILLSIRPSLPQQQPAEETAWQGGRCVPGTSPADQAQAAPRQCLPHQQQGREEFFKVVSHATPVDTAEPFDAIVDIGLRLGSFKRGRGQLPHRLRAGRTIRGGALRSRPVQTKAGQLCPSSVCRPLED
jgi:hypothetical protein